MESHTGTIDISGFKLQYIIEGTGEPVLVIGSALYYQRVFSENLRKQLQLIFIDHRGFVQPPRRQLDNKDFELEVLIDDIEKIRKDLKLDHFLVMGHSGHAFMALEYAKKNPDHITGVVMIGVTPDYSEGTHKAADIFFQTIASPERKDLLAKNMDQLPRLIASDPAKRFVSYCLAAGPKSWFDQAYDATELWKNVYTNMQMFDYVWGIVFRDIDICRNLKNFNKPVFLALGKFDFLTGPPELWNDRKKCFNDITIKIFEKSSHCPQFEEADIFDKELLKWVSTKLIQPILYCRS